MSASRGLRRRYGRARALPPGPYVTDDVLAGAYANQSLKALLSHTVAVSTGAPLCHRVRADSMAGYCKDKDAPPTCPVCLRRDPRFAKK
jgi:hypothetical protein